jgi:hypothetical protein
VTRRPDREPPRGLTEAERERLRGRVLASIEREEARRRRSRRLGTTAILGLLLAGALALAAVREAPPAAEGSDAIPVRCAGDGELAFGETLITAQAQSDPRLVCAELWRRGELIGANRKPAPLGACAQATGEGTLVLVYADPAHACRAGEAA